MISPQSHSAQSIYTPRASSYDATWHPAHALSVLSHARLLPGQHILDLACGTGLVTIPAARAVRPSGTVTGVDITDAMLDVARRKAGEEGVDVRWVNGDVMKLEELGLREEGYDLITCASCLPLLEEPGRAIKSWAALLKKGGSLVVDVPTEKSQLPGLVFEEVAVAMGVGLLYGRLWIKDQQSLERLFVEAGLVVEKSIVMTGFGSADIYATEDGGMLFDKWVAGEVGRGISEERREEARRMYIGKWRERAGMDEMVKEEEGFYLCIGKKE